LFSSLRVEFTVASIGTLLVAELNVIQMLGAALPIGKTTEDIVDWLNRKREKERAQVSAVIVELWYIDVVE
jgi:hypothetical protein